jgi:uncharacterized Fe-S cluster-containing radical SAM superfamily protein
MLEKFADPNVTADGKPRAFVEATDLETVWFNTGTLCNIECRNCYIESSPINDRLEYLSLAEVQRFLDEIRTEAFLTQEIGFTGGEPFMNPQVLAMVDAALTRGFVVLILTNAMRPMMRPRIRERLIGLKTAHGARLHLRVSLDHYSEELHDSERGKGSWRSSLAGLHWLASRGFRCSVAGRSRWQESSGEVRAGFSDLFRRHELEIDASDPHQLVLFPEMDAIAAVPEITVDCWKIVGVEPADVMCATSRMVVKRREAATPTVVACTLLPYEEEFELGTSLSESLRPVPLNHPHCAQFCVLGGGSCSVGRS